MGFLLTVINKNQQHLARKHEGNYLCYFLSLGFHYESSEGDLNVIWPLWLVKVAGSKLSQEEGGERLFSRIKTEQIVNNDISHSSLH